jgi:hypothetical protein
MVGTKESMAGGRCMPFNRLAPPAAQPMADPFGGIS